MPTMSTAASRLQQVHPALRQVYSCRKSFSASPGLYKTLLRPYRDYSYDESKQQLKRTNLPISGGDSTANLSEILGRLGA